MTQEELNKILSIQAIAGDVFYSHLGDINMSEDSKEKVEILFALTHSIAIKRIKENVASQLELPGNLNKILKELDALKEETKRDLGKK